MLGIIMAEGSLYMALNDLILANTLPHHGPQNCGRVLDALCRLVTPADNKGDRKKMWPVFREMLRLERQYVDFVMQASEGPRHGDRTFVPGNLSMIVTVRTWRIMNRFLEFRKRGNQPLPESEFPWLADDSSS